MHNERVAMGSDAAIAQTSGHGPRRAAGLRVEVGAAPDAAARCLRLPIARRLCIGAATSIARRRRCTLREGRQGFV
ncbi:hypothetical protein XFF6992_220143 [Xanthomonas citri pv. fuscans]|uniref:Uncharacterized protein n=1 Tax=Xanthomonas campestris pv. phaseoli TaxID=317013 RepID=A0A7Z7NH87_XANCH|nr:hypothetical protein XFF6990_130167 [Xanthomonas citri pv. fuscans]SOO18242.1 hypothetical protein XFF6992_220143 [Xanthomonas citri pv. fuscans]SOO24554.1 hypothetical protein XFF6991_390002 [Xanthomonas phaseoli pv. phaseoli]SOO31964.1 hypothetical protein XFF6994_1600004 [Xanthomonas citri pv. fuscans]